MDSLGSVRKTIIRVLAGISPDVRLTEFGDTPDGKWYTIRLHVPDTVSKPFVVPKTLVQRVPPDSDSLRTLRNVLRVEVLMQRSRLAVDRSRAMLAGVRPDPPANCPRCSGPIGPAQAVRFALGEVFHLDCGRGA
jgi:hypothetical protein